MQKKFRPRAQRATVIDEPNKMHRKRAEENRDPRTARGRNALEMGRETRESLGDEIRRECRRHETCGERPGDRPENRDSADVRHTAQIFHMPCDAWRIKRSDAMPQPNE